MLLICAVGGKAPPGPQPSEGGPLTDPTALSLVCPAPDPAKSPFPTDLAPADTVSAGALPGSFAVSSSGEATYAIPLVAPPGRAGMVPSLAVSYNSAAGEGFLGVGFGLTGLSVIARCPQNLAQDHHIRAVRYDEHDPYCLDGARLVQVGAQLASDGSGTREYRTFPDSFAKIIAHYAVGAAPARGPERFEVFTRGGQILDYGATPTGRAMAADQIIAAWWLTEQRDRRGNAIDYSYYNAHDPADGHTVELLPLRIGYAHHDDHTPSRVVELIAVDTPLPSTASPKFVPGPGAVVNL